METSIALAWWDAVSLLTCFCVCVHVLFFFSHTKRTCVRDYYTSCERKRGKRLRAREREYNARGVFIVLYLLLICRCVVEADVRLFLRKGLLMPLLVVDVYTHGRALPTVHYTTRRVQCISKPRLTGARGPISALTIILRKLDVMRERIHTRVRRLLDFQRCVVKERYV